MKTETFEEMLRERLVGRVLLGIDEDTSTRGIINNIEIVWGGEITGVRITVFNKKSVIIPFDQCCKLHFEDIGIR